MDPINLVNVCKFFRDLPHQIKALEYLQEQTDPCTLAKFAEMWRADPVLDYGFTAEQWLKIYKQSSTFDLAEEWRDPINFTLQKFGIDTQLRQIHFLAQVSHESGGFRWVEEIASGSAYEGRLDLGNNQPGDGVRFKGRGPIQLTGRDNYIRFRSWLLANGYTADPVEDPGIVATPQFGSLAAGWFWWRNQLNFVADRDDIVSVTKIVNGGYNGLEDRKIWLARIRAVVMA